MISVDPKCRELAEYFLGPYANEDPSEVQSLGNHIQQSVEDWLAIRDSLKRHALGE